MRTMRQFNYQFISIGNVAKLWNSSTGDYEEASVTGFYPGTKMVKLKLLSCGTAAVKSAEDLWF